MTYIKFYYSTVEVTDRFKGSDRMPEELWKEVCNTVQEEVIKTTPKNRNARRQNGNLRRPYKQLRKEKWKAKEKRKDIPTLNAEFQRRARRDEKAFLSQQCKETEENNRMGKTRDLFKKMRDTKQTFHAKMGTVKDANCMGL